MARLKNTTTKVNRAKSVDASADADLKQLRILAHAIEEKKGEDVVILDLRAQSSYLNYFLIATALSRAHLRTLYEEIHKTAVENQIERPRPQTPQFESGWVTYDLGFYIVHLFENEKRRFYDLESVWANAPRIPLVENRTHSSQSNQAKERKKSTKLEGVAKKKTKIKKKTIKEKKNGNSKEETS